MNSYFYEYGFDIENVEMCKEMGRKLKVIVEIKYEKSKKDDRMEIRKKWGKYGKSSEVKIDLIIGLKNDKEIEKEMKDEKKI